MRVRKPTVQMKNLMPLRLFLSRQSSTRTWADKVPARPETPPVGSIQRAVVGAHSQSLNPSQGSRFEACWTLWEPRGRFTVSYPR